MPSGKWYAEATIGSGATGIFVGLWNSQNFTKDHPGSTSDSYAYWSNSGNKYNNDSNSSYGDSFTEGDVIGVAFDAGNGTLEFYKNGVSQGTAYTGITSRNYVFAAHKGTTGTATRSAKWNFGQMQFKYPMPSGYAALNTTALPAATITDGSAHFDAKLWTGNGSSGRNITGYGFSPDLAWIKNRSNTGGYNHILVDSVRGAGKYLVPNANNAESTFGYVSALNSDGFTISNHTEVNGSSNTYVGWAWDAGSSTVSNTDGSITSSVRANPTAGFSIVGYTGTGANASVGHGLNAVPELILLKDRDGDKHWAVWHKDLSSNAHYLLLNQTDAQANTYPYWNGSHTSSVFTLGSTGGSNESGDDFIAYCFTSVAGYSAMGSYEANGSADGPFVSTSFRPALVICKSIDVAHPWQIFDSARGPENVITKGLQANSSGAEYDTTARIDFLSNGFKIRAGGGTEPNVSGNTYIYYAVAENPFQANGGLAR